MDYLQALRSTVDAVWRILPADERREALQAIESHIALEVGRDPRQVLTEEMKPGLFGFYNPADRGNLHLSFESCEHVEDALDTLFHEGRHAYQRDCLDSQSGFPQPTLDQFREGFNNYVDPEENFAAYANNFTERDARDFAERQLNLLTMERDALLAQQPENDAGVAPQGFSVWGAASARYSAEALSQWEDQACFWQPEAVKVLRLGGSMTGAKVYTNRDVMQMCDDRYLSDVRAMPQQLDGLSLDELRGLRDRLQTESDYLQKLHTLYGPDGGFGEYVDGFLQISDEYRAFSESVDNAQGERLAQPGGEGVEPEAQLVEQVPPAGQEAETAPDFWQAQAPEEASAPEEGGGFHWEPLNDPAPQSDSPAQAPEEASAPEQGQSAGMDVSY